ncbi:MAG TPA: glycosyltransferase [Flavobacteriales bacterium]|nr:glycosyltransferase [Flavobacteriales bacterium]
MFFSAIIPVYNRPQEVDELLESLVKQKYRNFEVVIIEDGSTDDCKSVVEKYTDQLDIQYFFKENSGQGFSRNYGFERARGDYFVVFDSDCLIPDQYFEEVNSRLQENWLDAYGGPDKEHETFSTIQKAISYSMTSLFTTGGIRGRKEHAGKFHPRSFNMGTSRKVYETVGGYIITRMGEDIEYSIRIIKNGFDVGLISNAFVYHKRRTNLRQFYKQLHFFGRARINIGRFFPKEIKLVHFFPAFFFLSLVSLPLWYFIYEPVFWLGAGIFAFYYLILFFDALRATRSLGVSILAMVTSTIQLSAYAIGFLTEGRRKLFEKG